MASRSSSPSEGEIVETSDSDKATKSKPAASGPSVDRPSRKRPSSSPRSPSTSRSRSPRRGAAAPAPTGPRGSKRSHDGGHSYHGGSDRGRDPRSFRVHYEDRPRRDEQRYAPSRRGRDDYYADSRGKRARRDASPPRAGGRREARRAYDDRRETSRKDDPPSSADARHAPASLSLDRKQASSGSDRNGAGATPAMNGGVPASVPEPEPEPEPIDEAALIEARRRRREAIKAKHQSQPSPMLVQALSLSAQATPSASQPTTPAQTESEGATLRRGSISAASPLTPPDTLRAQSPLTTESSTPREVSPVPPVATDAELANVPLNAAGAEDEGPSAADYDPIADMEEDKMRAAQHATDDDGAMPAADYDETTTAKQDGVLPPTPAAAAPAATAPAAKAPDAEFDMFAEADEDDMFAEEPSTKEGGAADATAKPKATAALDLSMMDDVDDVEGYYKTNMGELLDNRYQVQLNLGRGMFSAVVRAHDRETQRPVAIKIIRANETMRKAALKEIEILDKLRAADPDDRKHVVRLERHFEHRGHLCMVFESLSINLREVLKKFGRDVGINLRAVRAYSQQLFLGLSLLRRCEILHADLKPDNILVNESRNLLKVCDLGSASDAADAEGSPPAPYLVSRFYRAPEIILGMAPTFAIDVWSAGCTLFELYTGKILFAGRSNNQMLRAIIECRGRFPAKALRRADLAHQHFDDQGNFRSVERDRATGRDVVRLLGMARPTRDLRARLAATAAAGDDPRDLALFLDLLDKCLALNPDRRISPLDALKHPFLSKK